MKFAIVGLFLFLLTACCDTTAPTVPPEGYCKTWVNPSTNVTECQPWYLGD